MGISCDLYSDRRTMAHLGAMAFPRVFSLSNQLGVAWPPARTYRRDTRFLRDAGLSIPSHASGLVVSMVDRAFARRYSRLAPGDSPAGDKFRGGAAALLDGRCFYPAAISWTTPGLLFNDHVERICALGGRRVGSNTAEVTRRRCNRCRPGRHYNRGSGILSRRRGTRSEWKLGDDGRALDGLEGITRHARCDLAGISTFGCNLWRVARFPFAGSPVLHFQATRETCSHRHRRLDDPGWAQHDGRRCANRPLFFTCGCGAISKSAPRCRWRYNL